MGRNALGTPKDPLRSALADASFSVIETQESSRPALAGAMSLGGGSETFGDSSPLALLTTTRLPL